jgi:hypothetical protein
MRNSIHPIVASSLLCLSMLAPAHAVVPSSMIGFYGITANDPGGIARADGEANLKMAVIDLGTNGVGFRFTNDSEVSSLTDVYFDDGALLAISSISSSGFTTQPNTGVRFSAGAAPGNLPGGNAVSPAFATTAGFSADSDAPVFHYGVQNSDATGEWLAIDFALQAGKTYADVLAALTLPAGGDWLRVGVHVQGFAGGFSESFVSIPVTMIPEPGRFALMLAGIGLIGLGLAARPRGHTLPNGLAAGSAD